MHGINKIEFIFENCESFEIDGKYLGTFLIDKIETKIERTACNAIEKLNIANEVIIEIHRSADENHYPFGIDELKIKKFDRISKYNDITSIIIHFEDYKEGKYKPNGISEHYYVDWGGESETENEYQHSKITKHGDLQFAIVKDYEYEDYFNEEDEFGWEMIFMKE